MINNEYEIDQNNLSDIVPNHYAGKNDMEIIK